MTNLLCTCIHAQAACLNVLYMCYLFTLANLTIAHAYVSCGMFLGEGNVPHLELHTDIRPNNHSS